MKKSPEDILKSVFGYQEFRRGQKEIIQNVLSGRDTLAVMPTGGGKSLCYQIPALIFDGLTVVVSPLISLMQDQVGALRENGVGAVFLNSTLSFEEYKRSVALITGGQAPLVYLSPEALSSERIKNIFRSSAIPVRCLTVDEAHCVSEWGHDFRPDYMEIVSFRNEFKDAVCLALTATATKKVQSDIAANLGMKNPAVLISSFDRPNIFLNVQPRRQGLSQITAFLREHKNECGIIYCLSRKEVDAIARELQEQNFSAMGYHAGLSDQERSERQNKFIKGQIDVIVATVAFGMGINKPDVRFVIHYSLPKSIEEYYQEIGRAGRDGLASEALLLFSAGDARRVRFFFKDKTEDEAFRAERLLQSMLDYAQCRTCRRKFLLSYFDERSADKERTRVQGAEAPNAFGQENDSGLLKNSLQAQDGSSRNFSQDQNESTPRTACCDICASGGLPLQDATVPAQKFLSCAYRVGQRFGAAHIIDILLGSRSEKIKKFNHNFLSTWGIGTELSRQAWFDLAGALEDAGIIERAGEWNIVKVTPLGKSLLQNRDKIELPVRLDFERQKTAEPAFPKKSAVLHKKGGAVSAQDQALFDRLKAWRRRRADEENIPPYYIFSDRTLANIAEKRPASREALLSVSGIGEAKALKFGREVISIVEESGEP